MTGGGTLTVAAINAYAGATVIGSGTTLSIGTQPGQTFTGYTDANGKVILDSKTAGLVEGQSVSAASISGGSSTIAVGTISLSTTTLTQYTSLVGIDGTSSTLVPYVQTSLDATLTGGGTTMVVPTTAGLRRGAGGGRRLAHARQHPYRRNH